MSSHYETYHPRRAIDPPKLYKVDMFLRHWVNVNGNTAFLPGGRYFLVVGRCLLNLVEKSKSFEEHTKVEENAKKVKVCFEDCGGNREAIIAKFRKLFYSRPNAKTEPSFNKLCVRPRRQRYACRLSFNFLVVKRLQCCRCDNKCVYDALKRFYKMDSKCVSQVDGLVARLT
uniref:Late expression factor 2 homolog lef-2 n=1 Tax=Cydia pomonella granulosis virus TaxID=28289 RepID=O39625_GVCP|nr:late expression factor 2 homolog lef-2 [Cydia pomonella granulovirus]